MASGEHSAVLFIGVPISIGIAIVVALVWVIRRRARCPNCGKAKLDRDRSANAGGIELATGGRMYRCTGCAAEYRRHHDRGPFIPRAAWEIGVRDELPQAHVVPRKAT